MSANQTKQRSSFARKKESEAKLEQPHTLRVNFSTTFLFKGARKRKDVFSASLILKKKQTRKQEDLLFRVLHVRYPCYRLLSSSNLGYPLQGKKASSFPKKWFCAEMLPCVFAGLPRARRETFVRRGCLMHKTTCAATIYVLLLLCVAPTFVVAKKSFCVLFFPYFLLLYLCSISHLFSSPLPLFPTTASLKFHPVEHKSKRNRENVTTEKTELLFYMLRILRNVGDHVAAARSIGRRMLAPTTAVTGLRSARGTLLSEQQPALSKTMLEIFGGLRATSILGADQDQQQHKSKSQKGIFGSLTEKKESLDTAHDAFRRALTDPLAKRAVSVETGRNDLSNGLTINWADGASSIFHYGWLYRACPCPQCKQPHSGQIVLNPQDLPVNPTPKRVWLEGEFFICEERAQRKHKKRLFFSASQALHHLLCGFLLSLFFFCFPM